MFDLTITQYIQTILFIILFAAVVQMVESGKNLYDYFQEKRKENDGCDSEEYC